MLINGQDFEMTCDLIDVTSLHRPDTRWLFFDAANHRHEWYHDGEPAQGYNPTSRYNLPTLVWVKTGIEWWDDEPHDVGEHRCALCGARVEPGYTADDTVQRIPGLRRYTINGRSVPREEFVARLREAGVDIP